MNLVIYLISTILFFIGLYMCLCSAFRLPSLKQNKAVKDIEKRTNRHGKMSLTEKASSALSKKIRLPAYVKESIDDAQSSLEQKVSSEYFVSNILVKTFPLVITSILLLIVNPALSVIVFVCSLLIPLLSYENIKKKTEIKKRNIESELLGFVLYIQKCIKHSKDVLNICEKYIPVEKDFRNEMEKTVLDMRTDNVESALSRLEKRVCSALMSDICRGLCSVSRGDETIGYWQSMEIKLRENERMVLRTKANKLPSKTRFLSMAMLLCFISIYIVVLGSVVLQSLSMLL